MVCATGHTRPLPLGPTSPLTGEALGSVLQATPSTPGGPSRPLDPHPSPFEDGRGPGDGGSPGGGACSLGRTWAIFGGGGGVAAPGLGKMLVFYLHAAARSAEENFGVLGL